MSTVVQTKMFPRIIRFLETHDAPGSACPHCGASGRYIHRFVVDDGRTLAAMSGCVQLFPCSRIAREEKRLRKKEADYAKRGWTLNARDKAALDAISDFYDGKRAEHFALSVVDGAKRANVARHRGRR